MSFSSETKKELCAIQNMTRCCLRAQTGALLLFSRLALDGQNTVFRTKHGYIATKISEMTAACCGATVDITYPNADGKRKIYSVCVPFENDRKQILDDFGGEDFIKASSVSKSCCFSAFLRGAFLACGALTDPKKDYHLEFSVPNEEMCDRFIALLALKGYNAGKTARKNEMLVYFKDANVIEQMLLEIGAKQAYFDFSEIRALHDFRNKAQRVTNCECGNLKKTIAAAGDQLQAIKKISETDGLDSLPEELRELAKLRLENPEMSLLELGNALSRPLTKSGVSHRLRKIIELSK